MRGKWEISWVKIKTENARKEPQVKAASMGREIETIFQVGDLSFSDLSVNQGTDI